ncbi:metal-sulfur cluster assembly factor [Alkalibacterium putridalgicola]|uniref:Aromatic ring hydroxylase n=1 Tax=Alkalibacterium putridalgicola TaxID=426703 RepID=A0A1H7Q382_9LACT|nr:metal-sulfur cluster assembly factor [Alkalibacterium putridalgicola]GEK88071.1 aromatic ring hydroxylase [Alkalibacterium putridalgicola]SEL41935.1 Metal-sulfur cluster biosynthetic enzyme [Alkalibacterium putridalgicola]
MTEKKSVWTEEEIEDIKKRIMEAMEQVIDPELGIDIVNLGLVYEVNVFNGGYCEIKITLTTMGCPLADVITGDILNAMKNIPEVTETDVKLVWYPAWDTSRMSRYARIALGIR